MLPLRFLLSVVASPMPVRPNDFTRHHQVKAPAAAVNTQMLFFALVF